MTMTVNDIAADVITALSQTPGTSTQVYALPIIQQQIQAACVLMCDEMWWPDLMKFIPVTLDGSTGIITADLVTQLPSWQLNRYADIEAIYIADTNRRLKAFPSRMNPYTISDGEAKFMMANTNNARPFIVLPFTATTGLVVHMRHHPTLPMSSTDFVYLDSLMITYLAAYMHAVDDGTNPGQIDHFEKAFEKRLTQVKAGYANHAVLLDTRFPDNEFQWNERE